MGILREVQSGRSVRENKFNMEDTARFDVSGRALVISQRWSAVLAPSTLCSCYCCVLRTQARCADKRQKQEKSSSSLCESDPAATLGCGD
jgi:hypothetical protein